MKPLFVLSLVLILANPISSFSQTTYIFKGNGSWKILSNWFDASMPPPELAPGDSIIIDPVQPGECILDVSQTISYGAVLLVRPGKVFRIPGKLTQVVSADSTFTDSRDGQVYPYRKIGSQVWMTKNLNYAAPGSWCYENNAANCEVYGHLYDWNTALTVAPAGWHLPSDAEWATLTTYLGGPNVAGGAMKSTTLWNSPNTGATNSSGFAGLPGGNRDNYGSFYNIGKDGNWWSSTERYTYYAWHYNLNYFFTSVPRVAADETFGFSVVASGIRLFDNLTITSKRSIS